MRLRTLLSNVESKMRAKLLGRKALSCRARVGRLFAFLLSVRCGRWREKEGERERKTSTDDGTKLSNTFSLMCEFLFFIQPSRLEIDYWERLLFLSSSRASIRRRRSMLHINAHTLLPSLALSYTHRPLMKRRFHSSFILKCAALAVDSNQYFQAAEMFSRCCKSAPPIICS
jgi:hypothetical protein